MNRTAVLSALRRGATPTTVTALARSTGLSRPAVTRAVADLEERGLVARTDDVTRGSVGRPAQQVSFAAGTGAVAGLQINPDRVHVVLADLAMTPLGDATVGCDGTAEGVLQAAVEAVAQVRDTVPVAAPLWAIGVGSPGLVDHEHGTVLVAPSIPGWTDIRIADRLRDAFDCPVQVDNDINLAALGEQAVGATRDYSHFAYIYWDDRVGTGLFLNEQLYRGSTPAAGELGFVNLTVAPDPLSRPIGEPVDGAGAFERSVRLETVWQLALDRARTASDTTLTRALEDGGPGVSLDVLGEYRAQSPAARAVLDEVVGRFCDGLSTLVLTVDPGAIVLGGRAGASATVRALVTEGLVPRTLRAPQVLASELGDHAVAVGAVHLAGTSVEARLAASLAGGNNS